MSFIRRADQPIYNQYDPIKALKYSVGITPYDRTALGRYDYNQDGAITHSDVVGITNYNTQYAIDKMKRDAGIQPDPPIPTPMTMRRPTFQPEPGPPPPGSGDIVPFGGDNSMMIDQNYGGGIGGAFARSIRNSANRFNNPSQYAARITPEEMQQREEMLLDQMRNAPPGTTNSGPNSLEAKLGRSFNPTSFSAFLNSRGVGNMGGGGPSLEENIIDPNSVMRGRTARNVAPGTGGSGIPPIDRSQIGMPEPDVIQPPGFGGRGIPPIDRREIGVSDGRSDFPSYDAPPGYSILFGGRGGAQPAVITDQDRQAMRNEMRPAVMPKNFTTDMRARLGEDLSDMRYRPSTDPRYNPPQDQRRTPTQQMNPLQMLQERLMQQRAMQQRMNPMMGMGLGGFNQNGMGMTGFGFQQPPMRQPMGRFGSMGGGFPGQMFGMPQNRFGGIGFGGFGGGLPGMMFGGGGGYNPYQQQPQFGGVGFGGGFAPTQRNTGGDPFAGRRDFGPQQRPQYGSGWGNGGYNPNAMMAPQQQGNMGYGFGQQTFNQFQQPQQQNQYRFGAMGY